MNERSKALKTLVAEHRRVSLLLTAAMMIIYFGFILLVAFNKSWMGSLVVPGLSWGILLGALVIVTAWVLIYIYIRWANNSYDQQVNKLNRDWK